MAAVWVRVAVGELLNGREDAARAAAFLKNGSVLMGDCDPVTVPPRASRYTPVPGGVGPLTIAMLMVNTVASAERRSGVC